MGDHSKPTCRNGHAFTEATAETPSGTESTTGPGRADAIRPRISKQEYHWRITIHRVIGPGMMTANFHCLTWPEAISVLAELYRRGLA